ncbi:hypothetical protein EC988_008754 [Linderina pennispora]|nr:hypothetical protein EC988_008754 [Linderina pennispora]
MYYSLASVALVALALVGASPVGIGAEQSLERRVLQEAGMQPCGAVPGTLCPGIASTPAAFSYNNSQNKSVQNARSRENTVYVNSKDSSVTSVQGNSSTNLNYVGPV